jgi:hypothetical protein
MTAPDDPDNDMPYFPHFPSRSRSDVPQIGDGALDALLAHNLRPEETPATLRPVAEVLAALRKSPGGAELAGLDQALAEFRETAGVSDAFRRSRPRRPTLLRTLLSAKLGAAVTAAAVAALGSGVAAAYAGALPTALQKFAHHSIAAPAPRPSGSGSGSARASGSASGSPHATHHTATPTGPNPTGPAAYGLCTAYSRAEAHGNATQRAVAFRKLAAAAGGADKVAAYCATVPHPGATPSGQPTSHAKGRPSARPAQAPTSHPKGKPTSVPHGKPSDIPSSTHRP